MEQEVPGDPAREDPEEAAEDEFRAMTLVPSVPEMRLDYDAEMMERLLRFRNMGVPTDGFLGDL